MFLIGLFFFIYFRLNLSISSRDTIIGLKNSSFVSLLIFTFLCFNYLSFNFTKSFSNSKRLFFTFKNFVFCIWFEILSQYFHFYNFNILRLPFLCIYKNNVLKLSKQKYIKFKAIQVIPNWFWVISSDFK